MSAVRRWTWPTRTPGSIGSGAVSRGLMLPCISHISLRARRARVRYRVSAMPQWVYDFSEGSREMRDLLGGKGANVAEMTRVLGEEAVPSGFTITTEACVEYMRRGDEPDGLQDQVREALGRLEARTGRRFGDERDPLLVSVRSGARESMP